MDFVLSSNSAPKAPARRGKKKTGSRFAWLKVFGRRPARTVLTAAFSAVLVGIAVNALFFQTSRHPAPLFGAPATPDVKRLAAPAPMPAPRPIRPEDALMVSVRAKASVSYADQRPVPAAAQHTVDLCRKADVYTGIRLRGARSGARIQLPYYCMGVIDVTPETVIAVVAMQFTELRLIITQESPVECVLESTGCILSPADRRRYGTAAVVAGDLLYHGHGGVHPIGPAWPREA